MVTGEPAFTPNSRGNRLRNWRATVNDEGEAYLRLCGPESVVRQVEFVMDAPCPRRTLSVDGRKEWTHRLLLPRRLREDERDMLDLLTEVLTLEHVRYVDVALALDFYKIPEEGVDGYHWQDTHAGSLINRGKYWSSGAAGTALCDELAAVAERHPLFRDADVVLTVPSSKPAQRRFGERVAAGVARRLDKPLLRTRTEHASREPAKEGGTTDLREEFIVDPGVADKTVLVVDDVLRSGGTMSAMAFNARRAGATLVLALVGARTVRN